MSAGQTITRYTSHVTRHTSHATRHTSHATRHTSHVTRHTPHATRHTPHVSHVTRHTSHATRHTSHVTRHTSHVTRHTSHTSHVIRASATAAMFSSSKSKISKLQQPTKTQRNCYISPFASWTRCGLSYLSSFSSSFPVAKCVVKSLLNVIIHSCITLFPASRCLPSPNTATRCGERQAPRVLFVR